MTPWFSRFILACGVVLVVASPASAQRRTPHQNQFAVGLFAGISFPAEDVLENGAFLGVSGEGYLTPRIAIKGQFGGAWHDVVGNGLDGKVRPWHFIGSLVYNWEGGKWHPYVDAGIGVHGFRFGEGSNRPTDTKIGVSLGGGIEYFFTRSDTLVGDLTFHCLPGTADSNIFGYKARYTTLSGGYKKYF